MQIEQLGDGVGLAVEFFKFPDNSLLNRESWPPASRERKAGGYSLSLQRYKFVGCAKSRCEAWQRAQPRGAILRTRWATNRAVAHSTPLHRVYDAVVLQRARAAAPRNFGRTNPLQAKPCQTKSLQALSRVPRQSAPALTRHKFVSVCKIALRAQRAQPRDAILHATPSPASLRYTVEERWPFTALPS
jgi:hypothetical protein